MDQFDAATMKMFFGGGATGMIFFLLAKFVPGLLSNYKREELNQTTVDAQNSVMSHMDERMERAEARIEKNEILIHKQQVRITRFVAVFIKIEAYLAKADVPDELLKELSDLIKDE